MADFALRLAFLLVAMPVRIRYLSAKEPDAWRGHWPVVSPRVERATGEAQPRALDRKLTEYGFFASVRCGCRLRAKTKEEPQKSAMVHQFVLPGGAPIS